MLKINDWAIAHRGKHVVAHWCRTHLVKHCLEGRIIACGTHQRRHCSTGAGAVGDNSLGISRQRVVEVTYIAYGRLEVEDSLRSTASVDFLPFLDSSLLVILSSLDNRVAATCAWNNHYHAFLQGASAGIAGLRPSGTRGHVPAHVGTQENWRLAAGSLWHKDVKILIG